MKYSNEALQEAIDFMERARANPDDPEVRKPGNMSTEAMMVVWEGIANMADDKETRMKAACIYDKLRRMRERETA